VIRTSWTSTSAPFGPQRECTVIAAHLPLRGAGALPCALAHACRLVRVLRSTDGLLGHALAVQLAPPALWTVSAWADRTALAQFERSPAHRAAKAQLGNRLRPSTLVVWRCRPDSLPPGWAETRRRLGRAAATGQPI
jgi:antibiotic biosynthesis monooxygenase